MTMTIRTSGKVRLLLAAAPLAIALAAAPAAAQDTSAPLPASAAQTDQSADTAQDVVVTGTLFRNQSETNIASPVSVLTAEDLNVRGITTVQGALQTLASNNGPALTNSFTANGAFAGGASAVSLRGLTTNSTLVLFDGLRAAYYPLADDGSRNFVDLNTIPDEIVDRVEVVRDGSSSSYGADAIAGVVNIITKRQVNGINATAEAGIAEKGYGANQRLSLTAGVGDIKTQGFNVYVSGHYVHSDAIYSNQLDAPYNNSNQTSLCYQGRCGADNRENSPINYGGVSTLVPVFLVRPADATNTTAIAGSRYQFLNPVAGCGGLTAYNPTAAELAAFPTSPTTVCTQDVIADGGVVAPNLTRFGGSVRASADIGAKTHAYLEFNFEQSSSSYTGYGLAGAGVPTNSVIRANAPAGIDYPRFSTSSAAAPNAPGSVVLALPVYICPAATVGDCNASNGTLNPNNPFAAQNEVARIIGTLPNMHQYTASRSRVYRLAGAVDGSFGNDWDWRVSGVGMINDLRRHYEGYVYIQHLLDVVKDGSYNFVNPSQNSQATLNYLAPTLNSNANSEEYQLDANLSHSFFDLPGGPLQVAVGGSVRYESVYAPSANPDYNGPTQRYFVVNAFGTVGHRTVESGYFELKAPIIEQVTLDASGRFDNYSSGQNHFSPKGGIVFNPIEQVTLRGTISGGFRIPSFGETSALPTTGYVPYFTLLPSAYLAQFSNPGVTCDAAHPANCSSYVTSYSIGQQSTANAKLKPETSRNITAGIDFRPVHGLTLTFEYYNIRKDNAIANAPYSSAINAYYAGQATPAGYTILQNAPDVNHPDVLPTISVVGAPYINANTIKTDGFDVSARFNHTFGNGWKISSMGEATYINKLDTKFADGHTEHYAGTLGNFNLTAGTGTPRWKASWQNTLDFGPVALSGTAYYTSGYNLSADDQASGACTNPDPSSGEAGLNTGLQSCNTHSFIDVDMNVAFNVNEKFTFYVNVMNVFNAHAPLDTATYSGYLYNADVSEAGIIGRSWRAGVRAKF